jgi:hypothetical protein
MRIVVSELVQTCTSCPSQWQGRTNTGGHIYVRFRHGELRIGVGASLDAAIEQAMAMTAAGPLLALDLDKIDDGYLEYGDLVSLTSGRIDWPQ